ncbi:MbnP family protein [Haloferula sargassicola]|uniref:Cytochrome c domain-containing protein n=1 Tax=Haloferula sargassicola TaxID=490096 RepID=A0ABP9UNC4_9BACT
MPGVSSHHLLALTLILPPLAMAEPTATRDLRIEVDFLRGSDPLTSAAMRGAAISRADLILSDVSFQRPDGSWLPPARWDGFFSATAEDLSPPLRGLPVQEMKAVRFFVGPPEAINHADPASFAADDPLNPARHNMHWEWQSGFIFLALEGRLVGGNQDGRGFSYHLGNDPQRREITVPIELPADHGTLRLGLDLDAVLDFDLTAAPASTHSREGDPLAAELAANTTRAFRFLGTRRELVQPDAAAPAVNAPPGTTPYRLEISHRFPQVQLPADNPLTREGVALGRDLFFDPALSADGSVSCASCHQAEAAFSDPGKARSLGIGGRPTARHGMPLFNLAWAKSFFWDGRSPSLREQVLVPIGHPDEMGHDLAKLPADLEKTYGPRFAAAFGSPGVTNERLGLAFEQFLLSLVSQHSRFDRALAGETEFTPQEKRGFQLFVTENDPARGLRGADCFHCHGGALFTDHDFHNNGLDETFEHDRGRAEVTGNDADLGKFKTPSLRNVALTAPYMHDGRFATLEEVIEHYDSGVRRSATLDPNLSKHDGLGLSAQDKADLTAFLRTLSDPAILPTSSRSTRSRPSP